eukprot:TRINITY_DN1564_c0_g1_i1.p1 TRINITY_DN1564_c0_g1~~TRINITY_DN1564_c0_g1_i1.p1  ORF type:complete len:500 (+),score=106.85 TRINITY_DN1564_c0_g1_i1:225-1724(+)
MAGPVGDDTDDVYPMSQPFLDLTEVKKNRRRRLLSLIAGLITLLSSGTLYAFSLYGDDLKDNLGWNQTELTIVAAFGNDGLYIAGIINGMIYDRYGAQLTLVQGAVFGFLGYFLMYFVDSGDISSNYWLASFFYVIIGFGSSASVSAALTSNIKNFPAKYRGLITGAALGCFGLSAFLVSQVNALFFSDDESPGNFLLFMAFYVLVSNIVGIIFVRDIPLYSTMTKEEADEMNREHEKKVNESKDQESSNEEASLLHKKQIDIGGWLLLRQIHFWLLVTIITIQAGAGLMYINNVGSIVSSLGAAKGDDDSDSDKNLQVSLLSISNSLGRLIIGAFSDWAVKAWKAIPRVSYLYISISFAAIAQAVLAFSGDIDPIAVTGPTIFNGMAYGSVLVLATTVLSEEFGTKYMGTNYGMLVIGVAAGGQVLNVLFGIFYDAEAEKQEDDIGEVKAGGGDSDTDCAGSECYATTMIIAMSLSFVSFACVTIFTIRKRLQASRQR